MAYPIIPSCSRPGSNHWDHDVFLSFRGEDTRKNFTDHLYSALIRAGICTFRDDHELGRGEIISMELINAIRGSRISLVVFSKGYASSRWCLDELVEIVHCTKTNGHTLLPIFYHVKPSAIRKQEGTFAEAFTRHEEQLYEEMERVQSWRAALTEAADCSGWDLEIVANGYEAILIEKIVEEVLCKLNPARLNVAKHPIGIDSHVEEMKALLNLGTSDVRIVGIYGMGGIGKTTIAKAVYNEIWDGFEGSCCLLNIKETSEQPNGLVQLQEQLLFDILKNKNLMIGNVDRGINLIKARLHRKKVLIVLDDVDHLEQFHALAGNSEWFAPGSRVITTTRDEHLLALLGASEKYKVEELCHMDSLQLFSWHAFKMPYPVEGYHELSNSAVSYAGGLPLALEVLGSYLFGKSIIEWKSALEKLQKIPHRQIQKILRTSFDSLDNKTMDIFLDIACFFIGMDKEYTKKILHACGLFPDVGLNILIQRSLLTADYSNRLRMHDLIRDMGREIVRERSPNDLGKCSRLWFHEDVLNVLSKHTASETVEGLILNLPIQEDIHLKTEAFTKMKNLRLLEINAVYLTGGFEHLSKELRWLCWHKCPLRFLPPKFHLENLVVLDMQYSNVKQVWKDNRVLNKLKVINLSYSKNLTKSLYFLQVPHLEILILEGCTSLVELHESIGHLDRLVSLNLEGCKNLRSLPRSISNLKSLETLKLSGCLKLNELPWIPKSLDAISLVRASIIGFCSLGTLVLSNCNLSEDEIPIDLGSLSSLQKLDLSENNFRNLPYCISRLPKLYSLFLRNCTSLHSILELPENIKFLIATGCSSMERLSILSRSKVMVLSLRNCCKLVEIQGLSLESFSIIEMFGCYSLSSDFKTSLLQYPSTKRSAQLRLLSLPGSEVPNWFSHQRTGSSISFHVPSPSEGEIRVLLICAVYASKKESHPRRTKNHVIIYNKTRGYRHVLLPEEFDFPVNNSDNLFLFQTHLIGNKLEMVPAPERKLEMVSGEEIEISFELWSSIEVKKCGVHLLVDKPNAHKLPISDLQEKIELVKLMNSELESLRKYLA